MFQPLFFWSLLSEYFNPLALFCQGHARQGECVEVGFTWAIFIEHTTAARVAFPLTNVPLNIHHMQYLEDSLTYACILRMSGSRLSSKVSPPTQLISERDPAIR